MQPPDHSGHSSRNSEDTRENLNQNKLTPTHVSHTSLLLFHKLNKISQVLKDGLHNGGGTLSEGSGQALGSFHVQRQAYYSMLIVP